MKQIQHYIDNKNLINFSLIYIYIFILYKYTEKKKISNFKYYIFLFTKNYNFLKYLQNLYFQC